MCWFFKLAEEEFYYCGEDDQAPPSGFSFGFVLCLITNNHLLSSFPRNADGVHPLFQASELLAFLHDLMVCFSICTEGLGVQAMSLLPAPASQLSDPLTWEAHLCPEHYRAHTHVSTHDGFSADKCLLNDLGSFLGARMYSSKRQHFLDTAPMDIIHTYTHTHIHECGDIYMCICIYIPHTDTQTHTQNHSHI